VPFACTLSNDGGHMVVIIARPHSLCSNLFGPALDIRVVRRQNQLSARITCGHFQPDTGLAACYIGDSVSLCHG
jgi:hypothetical protein